MFQIGWMKAGEQTVLTLHKRVITHNPRIRVTHDEHRTWTLRILGVREEDQGCYMCQINTAKMLNQVGCIRVLGTLMESGGARRRIGTLSNWKKIDQSKYLFLEAAKRELIVLTATFRFSHNVRASLLFLRH